jgi:uncharacterized protein YggE
MKRWIVPVAGGGVVAALLGVGMLAAVHDGPRPATAQTPTTVAPTTASATGGVTRTVSVEGVGAVSCIPDTVTVNLGVSVEGRSAAEALESANTKAKALISTLTDAGVGKTDIQTGYVSVWPRYRDNSQDVDGYWVSNSVTAVLHDIDGAGALIDAATNAVGDGITMGGVSFSIADTSGLYTQARQQAVTEARRRAGELAGAAGVSVGTVVSINESAQEVPVAAAYDGRAGAATTAVAASTPVPIEPGKQELQLRVQVVFELVG